MARVAQEEEEKERQREKDVSAPTVDIRSNKAHSPHRTEALYKEVSLGSGSGWVEVRVQRITATKWNPSPPADPPQTHPHPPSLSRRSAGASARHRRA